MLKGNNSVPYSVLLIFNNHTAFQTPYIKVHVTFHYAISN